MKHELKFNRHGAVVYMHERHPEVIDEPDMDVPLGVLHMECLWLQMHVCELLDGASGRTGGGRMPREARACLQTVNRLLVDGDDEVRQSVRNHFVCPHLVEHPEFPACVAVMPPELAMLSNTIQETLDDENEDADAADPAVP